MTTYRQATRPSVRALTPDTIPLEMRETDRWAVWRFEPQQNARTGELEWNKDPYQARNIAHHASSTGPRTWASFAVALRVYRQGGFDGLLFALGDGWAAGDFDDVVDADTGAIAEGWEVEARAFRSYVEYSPSGRGLRVLLHAAESKGLKYKLDNIEVYDHARFVTITGYHLAGTPLMVAPRQAELDAFRARYLPVRPKREIHNGAGATPVGVLLEDEALLAKARIAENGAKIAALLDGDRLHYKSPSEARGGLLFHLAFYSRDPAQLDRLMRRSPLVDPAKWERLGEREIEDALAKVTETYTPGHNGHQPENESAQESQEEHERNEGIPRDNISFHSFSSYNSNPTDDDFPKADPAMVYGVAGDIVAAIEPHTESSPVALLVQLLVSAGNAAGRYVHYIHEADRHYANLYALIVGDTAKARKGTSWGHVARVMRAADADWLAKHTISGLSSGEGIIHALRNVAVADIPLGDEGELLRDKRLLAREGEFASVLAQKARDGNILSGVLRDGWDGVPLGSLVKHSPERATNTHLSVIGHITQAELVKQLTSTDVLNGYANRFLFIATRRARLLPHGGDLEAIDRTIAPYVERLSEALAWARTPRQVAHDKEAWQFWEDEYEALSTGHPGMFGAATARAEAQMTRLALGFAILDCATAVSMDHLRASLALWKFAADSALYIFGDRLGDAMADRILAELRSRPDGMTRTEISDLFDRNADKAKIDAALTALEATRLAFKVIESTGERGRPPERWKARFGTKETKKKDSGRVLVAR